MTGFADTDLLECGEAFGDYRIVDLIGSGGMGQVYLAEIPGRSGRFAIKVMRPGTAGEDGDFTARFVREAEFTAHIDHPNIVKTLEAGCDPHTGLCYLVMEYMPGGSLRDIIAASPAGMSLPGIFRTASDLAHALEFMQANSIVHRDIKPDNVLFSADGTAKLADLGISRFQTPGRDMHVTGAGDVIGTPAYMAPEQMLDASAVDSRADIYSLGVMLYEMFAGKRPNAGESAMNSFAKAIDGQEFPDVRLARPDAPPAWAALISSMTHPSAAMRPVSPSAISALASAPAVRTDAGGPRVRIPPARISWYRDSGLLAALAAMCIAALVLAAALAKSFLKGG